MADGPDPFARFDNLMNRLVVVIADPAAHLPLAADDDPRRRLADALDAGMVRHRRGDTSWTTFVLKATFTYAGRGGPDPIDLELAPRRVDLSPQEPSWLPGAGPEEVFVPDDMVPGKAGVDVVLVGHAQADAPSESIACRLVVGACTRVFHVAGEDPERALGLAAANIRTTEALAAPPVGPQRIAPYDLELPDDERFERFHCAPPVQRLGELDEDATIELTGLRRGHETTTLRLPGVSPKVEVEMGGDLTGEGRRAVAMRLDTVWIDVDDEEVALVWRGATELPDDGRTVLRVVVGLTDGDDGDWRRGLIRGRLGYLRTPEDVVEERFPEPTDADPRAMAARFMSFLEASPEPRLDLQRYVEIASEVAEAITPEARLVALEGHGYREEEWLVEERAWLDKIARAAQDGNAALAHAYAVAAEGAQKRLGESDEELPLERYAELSAWMSRTHQPAEVLRRFELSIPAYLRHEERWRALTAGDPDLAAAVEAARARHLPAIDEELERQRVAQEDADAEREARWKAEDEALADENEEEAT